MEVGVVRVAEDKDFTSLKELLDCHEDWKLDFNKGPLKVWTKMLQNTNFKMIKVLAIFPEISPEVMYDVLHDPEYRKVWDQHMLESHDIGFLNPNNDVGYYSMSCPSPLANRDFVLQRSWLDLGKEKYILNHSVYHIDYPPKKGFIRATSYLTGFLVRELEDGGCNLGYISQTDPKGTLPPWLVNRVTHIFGPKMVKNLQKATLGYEIWKSRNQPQHKPWHFPEQITSSRLNKDECVMSQAEKAAMEEENSKRVPSMRIKLTKERGKSADPNISRDRSSSAPLESVKSPEERSPLQESKQIPDPPPINQVTPVKDKVAEKASQSPSKSEKGKFFHSPFRSRCHSLKIGHSSSHNKDADSELLPNSTSPAKSTNSPSRLRRSLKIFRSSKHRTPESS